MSKQIIFNDQAREELKNGVDKLANAVKATLGPKGRNVLIGDSNGYPVLTKDGVSVARAIDLESETERLGANLIKQAALNTVAEAGDGTTTSTLLAQAIINAGIEHITTGANPMEIKKGIDKAVTKVVEFLKANSTAVEGNREKLRQVALISANGDEEIADLVTEALMKVGSDGIVTIEESDSTSSSVKIVDGFQFDRGWLSPLFVNQSGDSVLNNVYILITDYIVEKQEDFIPILNQLFKDSPSEKALLVIAKDVQGDALAFLVKNKLKANAPFCAVQAPFGYDIIDLLEDIAVITGGSIVSDSTGKKIIDCTITELGRCDKAIISREQTVLVGGKGKKERIEKRLENLKAQLTEIPKDKKREYEAMEKRIGKLSSGIAILYVGGHSQVEQKEKLDRMEDALLASKAALAEGYSVGGGTAYLRALKELNLIEGDNKDQDTGINIISSALQAPLKQILLNAGITDDEIFTQVLSSSADFGYNARKEICENLLTSGVIDATKVLRVALENAASVGGMFLSTEAVVFHKNN
jgi:chaperonin GroEL